MLIAPTIFKTISMTKLELQGRSERTQTQKVRHVETTLIASSELDKRDVAGVEDSREKRHEITPQRMRWPLSIVWTGSHLAI